MNREKWDTALREWIITVFVFRFTKPEECVEERSKQLVDKKQNGNKDIKKLIEHADDELVLGFGSSGFTSFFTSLAAGGGDGGSETVAPIGAKFCSLPSHSTLT